VKRSERQALQRAQLVRSRKKVANKVAGRFGNIIFGCLIALLLTLVLCLVQSKISGGPPTIAGYRMYVVLSGSMNPEFNTGSLVAVKAVDPTGLSEGDIITFASSGGNIITHRIVRAETEGGLSFVTKGDANNVEDSGTVTASEIFGRVFLAIPYLGSMLVFSQSKQGLLTLIVIPAFLILVLEMRHLWLYACKLDREKAEKDRLKRMVSRVV